MESGSKMLLIHRGMKETVIENRTDLLLTPQFYTMRREALPVKYAYQAKRIAHSFFDGLLEKNEYHEYFVYKDEEAWILIAYNPEKIGSFLQSKKITAEKIGKIFFAQQIASQIDTPVALDEKSVMVNIDKIITIVPASALTNGDRLGIDAIKAPSRGIYLNFGSRSLISRKQMLVISGIFMAFGLLWLVEGRRYSKNNTVYQQQIAQLYKTSPSLKSSYTRENIAGKYRKIDKIERQKRQVVGKVAGVLFKDITLVDFEMEKKRYKAHFSAKDTVSAKKLERMLKNAGFENVTLLASNAVTVEGSL
jgi:hypothetical protein